MKYSLKKTVKGFLSPFPSERDI